MPISIPLGRLFGIPIGIHYSWFVIASLITVSLAARFSTTQPDWTTTLIWTVAVATAVLFFASIVLHELGHALVARASQLPVRSITLFALGGVAQIEKEATTAGREFWMAIAGPIVSVAIGLACLVGAGQFGWTLQTEQATGILPAMLGWLGYINIALAVFNLIPGYPLDGGRVLRSFLWRVSGDANKATRQAARTGQAVAFGFIFIGLFEAFAGAGFGGLWLALIGWFLLQASRANYARVEVLQHLRDVRVADVMSHEQPTVASRAPLQTLVDDLVRSGRRYSLVADDGAVVGLVTLTDVRRIDRDRWPTAEVASVMRPLETVRTVSPETPASDALEILTREDVNQLPVFDRRQLLGVLTRQQLQQVIRAHAEVQA